MAEVAARFTLDAMPGKQMSIDADLNAGAISEQEARKEEKNPKGSRFLWCYGWCQQVCKGDAIVSIIIVAINCIGGIIIGMTGSRGMDIVK